MIDTYLYAIQQKQLEHNQYQQQQQPNQEPLHNTPQINFAPVIKIINDGNDMSSTNGNPNVDTNKNIHNNLDKLNTDTYKYIIDFNKPISITKLN